MSTIDVSDVRRLLDSDQEDAVLVLRAGTAHVIAGQEQESPEYRGTLFLTSRRALLEQAGEPESEPELERLATMLSEMADRLGG